MERMDVRQVFREYLQSSSLKVADLHNFVIPSLAEHRLFSLCGQRSFTPVNLETRSKAFGVAGEDRVLCSSPAERIDARDVMADDQCMDVVRAFVGVDSLKVHEMPNHGIAIRDARGTKYVAGLACAFERHPNVVPLRQRNLRRSYRACLQHACETQREQLRFRNLLQHPNEFFLHQLETSNRATKLLTRFGVGERRFVTIDGRANHAPRNTCTRLREAR